MNHQKKTLKMKIRNKYTKETFEVTREQYENILSREGNRYDIIDSKDDPTPIKEIPDDIENEVKKKKNKNFEI